MKRLLILALVGALALSIAGPAAAKKKKKKEKPPAPVELQYFLRATESCNDGPFLSLTDAEDVDCVYGDTVLNPIYGGAGVLDPVLHYPAVDGLPLTLDPSRKVAASISTRGWNSTGAGISDWTFTLIATVGGEEKEIATHSASQTTGPAETNVLEFEMELDPAVAGTVTEELRLDIYIEGVLVGGRGVEHDEPVSSIIVPAFE